MIVRGYLNCGECGHPHIVRIGMGHEEQQRHQFACRSCHEPITVGLDVDYANISSEIIYGSNAVEAAPRAEGEVVNLDANFLIPDEDQGKELVFPRLEQGARMIQKWMADRRAKGLPAIPDVDEIVKKRPDFAAEWNDLRAAWSLWRNGNDSLSIKRVKKASAANYDDEPLTDLADWIFRFAFALGGPRYQVLFEAGIAEIKSAKSNEDYGRFCAVFTDEISLPHGRIFFELMKSYFVAFDEFAQVQFLVTSGADFPDARAASSNIDAVRMFYGNAFEAFTTVVEYLAYLNNLIAGRKFDEFASMDREKYVQLDKASRFRCFEANQAFTAICVEADNVLRNASHHGGFEFDARTQDISYRAGKGGQGDEQRISYTDYLRRCTELFMQILVVMRLELVLASNAGLRAPL